MNNTIDRAPANATDRVDGSFRQAILDANATPGADIINFNLAGPARIVYTNAAPFPEITDPVTIDGFNLSDRSRIELVGTNAPNSQPAALVVKAGHSTIRGLVINGFATGILLQTNGFNIIEGNFIGTDLSGSIALTNRAHGIWISQSPNNLVGGITAEARNILSGNGGNGVRIEGRSSVSNRLVGNFIGTDVSGAIALGNAQDGLMIFAAANNTIGGTNSNEGNLISGNGENGLLIVGAASTNNRVQGNFVGTDVTGTQSISNTIEGISLILGAAANLIGGTTTAARNIISGNGVDGVDLNSGTSRNLVQGNYIGTDVTGTNQLGNDFDGVYLENDSFDNLIGGKDAGAGNIIAFNGSHGIFAESSASGNAFWGNSIFSNDSLGIDLGDDGVTPNDDGDADTGPNNLQNFPELSSATSFSNQIAIQGTLSSEPNTTYRLEFFSNGTCDASGHGEGAVFLGASEVTTDGNGNGTFNITLSKMVEVEQAIAATATDPAGNTSEFSNCVLAAEGLSVVLAIHNTDQNLLIAWPRSAEGFQLEVADSLSPPIQWTKFPDAPAVVGEENSLTIKTAMGTRFFRLRRP